MNQKERRRTTIEALGDVVSTDELASLFGVTPKMVYRAVSKGALPSFRFGKMRLFLKKDVLAYIGYQSPAIEAKSEPTIDEALRRMSSKEIWQTQGDGVTVVTAPDHKAQFRLGSGKGGTDL